MTSGRSPRLCLLTETYYPVVGGGEKQTQMLAADLGANGIDVFVTTRRSDRALSDIDSVEGVKVYRVSPVGAARWPRWRMVCTSLALLTRRRRDYDIIFVSGFKALGLAAVAAARIFGKQCVLKADSNGEMSGAFFSGGLEAVGLTTKAWPFRGFLAIRNAILRKADHFVAITGGIAHELIRHGVDATRIHVVSNGVDTTRFRPVGRTRQLELRRRLGLPNTDALLVYSGRLVSYKGLPLLVRVVERLREEHNVGLVLVGAGGMDMHNCERELRAFTVARGLEASIHFAGDVSNVHEFLQAADVFVLPTEDDAFPLSLVEAMACGLPVVSTRVGGIVDIVTDGQDGLLVEAGDAHQLTDALRRLIADASLSATLGAAAAVTVQARYSRRIVAQRYIALFQHVHDGRPSRSPARRIVRSTRS